MTHRHQLRTVCLRTTITPSFYLATPRAPLNPLSVAWGYHDQILITNYCLPDHATSFFLADSQIAITAGCLIFRSAEIA